MLPDVHARKGTDVKVAVQAFLLVFAACAGMSLGIALFVWVIRYTVGSCL